MSRRPIPKSQHKTYRPCDDEDMNPHSLYRLFDEDDQLMYIGVAFDVTHRIYMHEAAWYSSHASMQMFRRIARHTTEEYPNKLAARAAERAAIKAEAPLYNRQHNPKRWRRVAGQWQPVEGVAS